MSDDLTGLVRDWLLEPDGLPEPTTRPLRERIHKTPQDRGWRRLPGGPAMAALLPICTIGVTGMLLAGLLLVGPGGAPAGVIGPGASSSAAPGTASAPPVATPRPSGVERFTATVKGGWHEPDDGGCSYRGMYGKDWAECFLVDDAGDVTGKIVINAQDGDDQAGWGSMVIWESLGDSEQRTWQGSWFASGVWPKQLAEENPDGLWAGPLPRRLDIDTAYLVSTDQDPDRMLVLSVTGGQLDGWTFDRPWSRFGEPASASLPGASERPALVRPVSATVMGGWHEPDEGGCTSMSTAGGRWMYCFLLGEEASEVQARIMIGPRGGNEEVGWGLMQLDGSSEEEWGAGRWSGPWFTVGAWPKRFVDAGDEDPDLYGPHPSDLRVDTAWLRTSAQDDQRVLVLSIVDGQLEGWLIARR